MRYKGVQRHKADPAKFRVSIKFTVPGSGIRGSTHIHNWLKRKFGPDGFGLHPARWDNCEHSIAVYFNDPKAAPEIAHYIEDIIDGKISYELCENLSGNNPGFYTHLGEWQRRQKQDKDD